MSGQGEKIGVRRRVPEMVATNQNTVNPFSSVSLYRKYITFPHNKRDKRGLVTVETKIWLIKITCLTKVNKECMLRVMSQIQRQCVISIRNKYPALVH